MANKNFLENDISTITNFLSTDLSIRLFPRLTKRGKCYDFWSFPHILKNNTLFENYIIIQKLEKHKYHIYVYTEDYFLKDNEVHLSNIENLIHDIANELEMSIEYYEDLSSSDYINKLESILEQLDNENN